MYGKEQAEKKERGMHARRHQFDYGNAVPIYQSFGHARFAIPKLEKYSNQGAEKKKQL